MAVLITDEEGNFVPQILDANSLQYTEIKGENNTEYIMIYSAKPKNLVLQNSASSIGNGTDFIVDGYGIAKLQVTGTFVGEITVKGSVDGTNFVVIKVIKDDNTILSSITSSGIYEVNCKCLYKIRAEITSYTSGNITVTGKALALNGENNTVDINNIPNVKIDQSVSGTTNAIVNKNTSGTEIFTNLNPGYLNSSDGGIVSIGLKADVAITDYTTSGSLIAFLKGLIKQLQGDGTGALPIEISNSIPSGTANIGKVVPINADGTEKFTDGNPGSFKIISGGTLVGATINVTTAGTRIQLPSIPCKKVIITAKRANTGYIYIGGSDVSSTVYGLDLSNNEYRTIEVSNTNLIYIDSSVSGEGISYIIF